MMKNILKLTSIVLLVLGTIKAISGDPAGFVMIVAGAIMDLQAGHMDLTERILGLENKEKKDATQSTQGS